MPFLWGDKLTAPPSAAPGRTTLPGQTPRVLPSIAAETGTSAESLSEFNPVLNCCAQGRNSHDLRVGQFGRTSIALGIAEVADVPQVGPLIGKVSDVQGQLGAAPTHSHPGVDQGVRATNKRQASSTIIRHAVANVADIESGQTIDVASDCTPVEASRRPSPTRRLVDAGASNLARVARLGNAGVLIAETGANTEMRRHLARDLQLCSIGRSSACIGCDDEGATRQKDALLNVLPIEMKGRRRHLDARVLKLRLRADLVAPHGVRTVPAGRLRGQADFRQGGFALGYDGLARATGAKAFAGRGIDAAVRGEVVGDCDLRAYALLPVLARRVIGQATIQEAVGAQVVGLRKPVLT